MVGINRIDLFSGLINRKAVDRNYFIDLSRDLFKGFLKAAFVVIF